MSLDDIIRAAVDRADDITKSLQVTVTVKAWTGQDGEGDDTFSAAVSYPALVERQSFLRSTASGEQYLARALVTFLAPVTPNGTAGRQEPLDPRDVITLPDGFTAPIVEVRGLLDPIPNRPYALEILLGDLLSRLGR